MRNLFSIVSYSLNIYLSNPTHRFLNHVLDYLMLLIFPFVFNSYHAFRVIVYHPFYFKYWKQNNTVLRDMNLGTRQSWVQGHILQLGFSNLKLPHLEPTEVSVRKVM